MENLDLTLIFVFQTFTFLKFNFETLTPVPLTLFKVIQLELKHDHFKSPHLIEPYTI